MRRLVAALAALALAGAGRAEEVTLRFSGGGDVGEAVRAALAKLPSVTVEGTPAGKDPSAKVTFDPGRTDLGEMARALAGVKAPEPGGVSAVLVLPCGRLAGNPKGEVLLARMYERGLGRVKGVIPKKSKLDTKRGEICLGLDPRGGAKLADIHAAFPVLRFKR